MMKKYLAECIGTFALSFIVVLAVASPSTPIPIPVIAGITLALFVYSIGPISGCHINPSVTLGQLSVKKISFKDAVFYVIAQCFGVLFTILLVKFLQIQTLSASVAFSNKIFIAEILGSFFFNFGLASVVYGKAKGQVSGIVVGGSLFLGVMVASFGGALGILNPAVAIALNSLTVVYLFAPMIGSVIGFWVYAYLVSER